MAVIKAFIGSSFNGDDAEVRTLVSAGSQPEAAKLVGASLPQFRHNFRVLPNTDDFAILARNNPRKVFKASHRFLTDFKQESV